MANIEGASSAMPGVYSKTETIQRGVSVPIGQRLMVIIGEGETNEVLINSANGGGNDGFNSTYTSTRGADGRHFLLGRGLNTVAPVIQNRTLLYKNGVRLNVLEDVVTSHAFDSRFDARVDYNTGQIELQSAYLVDQGGELYYTTPTNIGNGVIQNLTLADANAPAETWTVRCSSVRRDGYGNPVDGYAKFIAKGSESGVLLDGYGNVVSWQSNGVIVSNRVLSFSIRDGLVPFREGDSFVIEVAGGRLVAGDHLTAKYISSLYLNDPEFFSDMNLLVAKHGFASTTNTLSLGAQIAFANGIPGLYTIQAKPSIPRRVSYVLKDSANGQDDAEDLTFELPLNVVPDADSNIHFFVTSPITSVETQIIPNKVDFFDPTITANPDGFIFGPYSYSYTVVLEDSVQKSGTDGVLVVTGPNTATLASTAVHFGLEDTAATRKVVIQNSVSGNDGTYTIQSISLGKLTLFSAIGFGSNESNVEFLVTDSVATSPRILFTRDLALNLGEQLRCTLVDYKDAQFFDAGWIEAYEAAERISIDMVVPLPSQTKSAIFQNGKVHVETMSNIRNKKERMLFIGAIKGLLPENIIGTEPAAVEDIGVLEGIQGDDVSEILSGNIEDLTNYSIFDAFGDSYRVVYMYPDQIVVQAGSENSLVDGFYAAPAAAAFFSANNNFAEPLTNKVLAGFSILRDRTYTPLVEENIVNAGATLLVPVQGGGRVIWGKTTTLSLAAEEQEISIIFIRDKISKAMRRAFLPYIGKPEAPTTEVALYAVAQGLMQAFLQQRLITNYAGLNVSRDPVEPRQWNVVVAVQPTYPINWVYIKISVGRLD